MSKNEKVKQMQFLIEQIKKADYNYYIANSPTISDYEYDKLEQQLKILEAETGITLPESTTHKMRVERTYMSGSKFKKHRHINRLYSLQKCNTRDELREFCNDLQLKFPRCKFVVQYKFDGFNLCLTYKDGKLLTAATRGDGEVGELVTEQAKVINGIPHQIAFKGTVEIQGECIMQKSVFEAFNKTATEKLINERNAAAGAVRNLDPQVTKSRNLSAIFYTVNFIDGAQLKTEEDVHTFLAENKIPHSSFNIITDDIEQIIEAIDETEEIKSDLDFQIDGMVVRLNDFAQQRTLGYTNKFPRAMIAFKFEAEEQTTILRDVVWQVGRTGKLTPIANLDEVFLAGAKIKRATLNNAGDIERKKIKIGCRVLIRRSNEVIPEVLGVTETPNDAREIKLPHRCPSCNGKIIENGANIFCINSECEAILKERLVHFCNKKAFNIRGISEKTIDALFDNLKIRYVYQLFDLTENDLATVFKQSGEDSKQARNVFNEIKKSKHIELNKFIYALGINGIGEKHAKTLAARFGSIDALKTADEQMLTNIKDIGPIVAQNIVSFFKDEQNQVMLAKLFEHDIVPIANLHNRTNKLSGQIFVITGIFENFSREQLTDLIEQNGGIASGSVSKKTNFVVYGESAGSKLTKARQLGVQLLTLQELLDKLK